MGKSNYALTGDALQFFAHLSAHTREHPQDFDRGADYLLDRFSIEAVRRRRARELRDAQREHDRTVAAWEAQKASASSEELQRISSEQVTSAHALHIRERILRELTVWTGLEEACSWAAEFPHASDSDGEAEAQFVVLVAALGYDEDARTNHALPFEIRRLLEEPSFLFARRGFFAVFRTRSIDRIREAWRIVAGEDWAIRSDPIEGSTSITASSAPERSNVIGHVTTEEIAAFPATDPCVAASRDSSIASIEKSGQPDASNCSASASNGGASIATPTVQSAPLSEGAKRELPPLNDTDRAVLELLRSARNSSEYLTARQLAARCSKSEATVHR